MRPAKVGWFLALRLTLEKNLRRLMVEVRETGELSVLLSRAARGQKLNREERQQMRAQLLDLAKAIPALAIFVAPGGVLMLIVLARVLPFSLLPSAFQEATVPPPLSPPEGTPAAGLEQAPSPPLLPPADG